VTSPETIAMRWPEFVRSTTLRWTALLAAIFAAFVVAMLGFVYLKTKHDLTIRYDRSIRSQMASLRYCRRRGGSTRLMTVSGRTLPRYASRDCLKQMVTGSQVICKACH
jgi:hypothetical protein